MNYTPYSHLTDDELLSEVYNHEKHRASHLELELAQRLEFKMEELEFLRADELIPSTHPAVLAA